MSSKHTNPFQPSVHMCCHANGIMYIVPLTAEHVQYNKRKLALVAKKR